MSILVLGTVALDTVETPFGKRKRLLGGSAVHFSMSARLFTQVNLAAIVGNDFPPRHIRFLEDKGVILTSLIRSGGETFKWEGKYEGDLNTALTLDTCLGVLTVFKPVISDRESRIKNIFLANVDPDIQRSLLKRLRSPRLVGLDSMNYWIKNKRKELLRLLKEVNIYVANDQEARSLSGENNLIRAARYLKSLGPDMVLIKKGEHGVLFYSPKFIFALPAYPVDQVIDPTGAGDTFAGAFMGYLARRGKSNAADLKRAIAYGTVAASFNVEGFGLEKTSRMNKAELKGRLDKFKSCFIF
ncbi:MAG TPA: PfkB family carbohydrate kinase [Candidatus Margulisiibacteriota bacterium]|nr:PfkB family carbohydrate kinase [Candidatus Margulisiibacteriota bacterium]